MDHYARLSVMAQLNGNNRFFKSNCQVGHNLLKTSLLQHCCSLLEDLLLLASYNLLYTTYVNLFELKVRKKCIKGQTFFNKRIK